jgi:hypothetical protein
MINKELVKLTQQGLNELVNAGLPLTGNYLARTTANGKVLINRLKAIYKAKGYIWAPNGNFGAVRMNDVLDNKFTDWGFLTLGEEQVLLWPMSTKPGLLYMQQANTKGGIVKEGQWDCYQIQGPWFSGLEFLFQVAPIEYYRDYDLDNMIDRGKVYSGIEGFNWHSYKNSRTGWFWNLFVVSDKTAGIMSKGCQVAQYFVYALVWRYIKEMAALRKGRIRYTLLHFKDFS